jgi:hypothetical protein
VPILCGVTAIILGVIMVPLSYEFSPTSRATFHYGAVALSLFGLILVLVALQAEKKFSRERQVQPKTAAGASSERSADCDDARLVMEVQSSQIMTEENLVWRRLLDRYATCTRTFAEAVAGLGQYRQISADALALWEEIKRLQAKCLLIAQEIDHHISRRLRSEEADAGGVMRRSDL